MGWKSKLIRPIAAQVAKRIDQWSANALACQTYWRKQLVAKAAQTAYGRDHDFASIRSYSDFRERVPLADYEGIRPYIDRIKEGESDILWPGKPAYLAKTSGTTSGVKYIPLTRDSLPNHFGSARNALFNYASRSGNLGFFDGKMIFLSGSPELEEVAGIKTGRLSGIVNHQVPGWLRRSQVPSYATNCIEDWETKLDAIVEETWNRDMRLISGIPPWVQMYYERLLAKTGKSTIREIFPHYSVFAFGGVNFEPYREQLEALVGARIASVETYPASEGFIAFQDRPGEPGLLLNAHSGIFFEFVPLAEINAANPRRLSLGEVELGVNYAIILNNNAGLFGYNIGDTVEFISLNPYRILVTGRIKHFISAFGEHVIAKEVEAALLATCDRHRCSVVEFTVAPEVNPPAGLKPYHEWFIEFDRPPEDMERFAADLDAQMVQQNIYYEDLIAGNILQSLQVRSLRRSAFVAYMKSQGKLGGQNKVPRLSNDRQIAALLEDWY